MKKNMDELTQELTKKAQAEKLEKYMPPKLAYRFRKWMKSHPMANKMSRQKLSQLITEKTEEVIALRDLKKNEVLASFFKSGAVKLDFGADVSDKVKKSALEWAKKKGLVVVEASLAKSHNSHSTMVFAKHNSTQDDECVQRLKIDTF